MTHLAVMYGQTEATARMSSFFLDQYPDKLDSVGKAIPGGSFQIRNVNHRGEGDIYYRGSNVCLGYVRHRGDLAEASLTCREFPDYLDTGDVGRLDEEAYLYITGRKKRFVKCNGIRVSLDELERSIEKNMAVPAVCISKASGEQIELFVRSEDFEKIHKVELAEYLRKLGIRKSQYQLRRIKEFYYRDNGKIDYVCFK